MKKILNPTHRGYLIIEDKEGLKVEIPCAVLENGEYIISHTGLYQAFKRPRKAEKKGAEFPAIISARNLQQFFDEEIRQAATPIRYYHTNGTVALGYTADFLEQVADLFLLVERNGKLLASQKKFVAQAKIVNKAIPKTGINDWIDEVTGRSGQKQLQEITELLKPFVFENLLGWARQCPIEFYEEIFRIHKWKFFPSKLKKGDVQSFGRFINEYLFQALEGDLLEELKTAKPRKTAGVRPKKQLEVKIPYVDHPRFNHHLVRLNTVLELSDTADNFKRNFDRVFRKIYQMSLGF